MSFYRFLSGGFGVYEAVERDCPQSDPRREAKPDGSWLPRVGADFKGAISFWTDLGLQKYMNSGLQEWHRSVTYFPPVVHCSDKFSDVLYQDEFQVIVSPSAVGNSEKLSWEKFQKSQKQIPLVDKVVAYVTNDEGSLLVFDHDKKWSEAGTQVPAGSVDQGEEIQVALLREVAEESGLEDLEFEKKIDEYTMYNSNHGQFNRRHIYHLRSKPGTPDKFTHQVSGKGEDEGMSFHYRWLPLERAHSGLSSSLGSSQLSLQLQPLLAEAEASSELSGFVYPDDFDKVRVPILDQEKVVGFLTPREEPDGSWRTGAIYVKPESRGEGLANQAIREFMNGRRGKALIEDDNLNSQRAFSASGFRKIGPARSGDAHWWQNF